jgi:hypothetical protein
MQVVILFHKFFEIVHLKPLVPQRFVLLMAFFLLEYVYIRKKRGRRRGRRRR